MKEEKDQDDWDKDDDVFLYLLAVFVPLQIILFIVFCAML